MVINYDIPQISLKFDYESPFDLKKSFVYFFQMFVCVGATGLNLKSITQNKKIKKFF